MQWKGDLQDSRAQEFAGATVVLAGENGKLRAKTAPNGRFYFPALRPGDYRLSAIVDGAVHFCDCTIIVTSDPAYAALLLNDAGALSVRLQKGVPAVVSASRKGALISEIPLNKRDLGQILLLAAGTASDANGAANFTEQYAINGQRGVETSFAMDGADISDPELGGGTFTNFNVDAIRDLVFYSTPMPAEIGMGASGLTNILTRAGTDRTHGSFFEFLRNSSLDARNYFDYPTPVNPRRIPSFRRNEFGLTHGGRMPFPWSPDRRGQLFYFVEAQVFRQALGTTQVISVPTAQERAGVDSTAFPGDVLTVPVDPDIANVLAQYPLPNNVTGAFGRNTYAAASTVVTNADQISCRLDYQFDVSDHFFLRSSFDNLDGPETNPDQTLLNQSFGVGYRDRQRNGILSWVHQSSSRTSVGASVSVTRTTPSFITSNEVNPAIKFNDALFEPFNAPAGTVSRYFGNLLQIQGHVEAIRGVHAWMAGGEVRLNRDSTYYGYSPNGEYNFGGGVAYAPYDMSSQSGLHTVHQGDPLPDTLSALLSGSPFTYTRTIASRGFSNGGRIGPAADSRSALALYVEDRLKTSPAVTFQLGLRYELYTPFSERARRDAGVYTDNNGQQTFLINPKPVYRTEMNTWGPRAGMDLRISESLMIHASAAITTIPPNLSQTNGLTGGLPTNVTPRVTAGPSSPLRYGYQLTSTEVPPLLTSSGIDIYGTYKAKQVPANTIVDIAGFERALASAEGSATSPLNVGGIDRNFGNAALASWATSLTRSLGKLNISAAYIGTTAWKLPRIFFQNAYAGATAQAARFTQFDRQGVAIGGFGTESIITASSHSTYHALQVSGGGPTDGSGSGVQVSYTFSKSIDDSSTVGGTSSTSSVGAVTQAAPQNPFDTHPERGPSNFDVTNSLSISLSQNLPLHQIPGFNALNSKCVRGWSMISISNLSSGTPFTVYSGLQQTQVGTASSDRPDQVGQPILSASRPNRQDYFGRGGSNASYFFVPIHVAGGTGPQVGRFGTLGRNTFRGPAYYDYDIAIVKDTPIGRRASGSEALNVQFRSEFFNILNIVNMGLPSNTIAGSGFGQINRTAGNSRQLQFSLKIAY